MPNNTNERKGKQAGELSAEERFRNFFSTSVIDLPDDPPGRACPGGGKAQGRVAGQAVQPRQGRDARPGTACAGDPHRRDPAGGRCKAGTAGAGGHGAGTAYRRPCSGNADAARQPRACQGSSGRAGACTQGGCCRAAGAGKARAPAGAAACCSPPKAA